MRIDVGWEERRVIDRRSETRRRTRRKAMLVVNNGWSTFGGQVLNLSSSGALVEMDAEIPVPEFFQIRYDGVKKVGRRVWTRQRQLGVAFE